MSKLRKMTLSIGILVLCFVGSALTSRVHAQTPTMNPVDDPIADPKFLLEVNPLTFTNDTGSNTGQDFINGVANVVRFDSPADFINELLPFLFSLAGLILFVMILWGGFEMLYSVGDDKAFESGKQRITAAIIGFVLLFCSYWIAQIIQFISGVNILG